MKHLLIVKLAILFFIANSSVYAQERPFPQNVRYNYGYKSGEITSADAKAEYDAWIKSYYVECSSTEARINYNGNTVSEGMGYGLVITAYAGDKVKFDKLWNYYKNRKNGNGVMNWEYPGCSLSASGYNAATDGDLDAAMGILVACHQWPNGGYENDAATLMNAIRTKEFTECNGYIVQMPGDAWGGCTCTNPSYYSPGYYRAFAEFYKLRGDNDASNFWTKAADDCYYTLLSNQHPQSGLITAWANYEGGYASNCNAAVSGGGSANTYQYDACRGPWRVATDYLWWGSDDAYNFMVKITNFVKTKVGGIDKVKDGYNHDGTVTGQWHNAPFVGSFALCGMATSQADADNFMSHFKTIAGDNYFNTCLAVMYKFLATGNYWNPYAEAPNPCSKVDLGTEKTLCGAGNVDLNANVAMNNNVTFTWFKNTNQVKTGSSNTLNVTQSGTYKVVMDSAGVCSSESEVIVSASLPDVDLGNDIQIGVSAILDANIEGSGIIYKWYKDDLVLSNAIGKILTVTDIGKYKVEVSATGCASKSDEILVDKLPYISKTSQSIVIDGVADNSYVKYRELQNKLSGNIGAPNIAASWSALWDNSNLYLLVNVIDNDLQNESGSTWYNDDGVEIFIDGDNSKKGSYDKINDFQYGFVWNTTTINTGSNNPANSTNNVKHKFVTTTDGYILEVSIPWSNIGITPSVGSTIGIDIAINDDDGGGSRENKISWYATTDDGWQNPSLFGTVTLTDEEISDVTQTISFTKGWNLVSFYVQPSNASLITVFGSKLNDISVIKTDSEFYINNNPLNSITQISIGEGYLIYAEKQFDLSVTGKVNSTYSVQLEKGWNLIGNPIAKNVSISSLISPISGNVDEIRTLSGSYKNGTLQNFDIGKGYFIKVKQPEILKFE